LVEIPFRDIVEQSRAGIYVIQRTPVSECDLRRGDGYALEGLIGKLVGLSQRVREQGIVRWPAALRHAARPDR